MKLEQLKENQQFIIEGHPEKNYNSGRNALGKRVGVYAVNSVDIPNNVVHVTKMLSTGLRNIMGIPELTREDIENYAIELPKSEYVHRKLPSGVKPLVKLLKAGTTVVGDEQKQHIVKVLGTELEKVNKKRNALSSVAAELETLLETYK